ncbi:HpcH/HpaI aldolase/citrate lyase family protein (plasmid) [Chimaeribacter arupi]|uniref:Citrate lyase subunit beta n=2 Tax=Yersiniaceae TaxID=1903411 RepID=A0A2N5EMQ9_9GAMM|nr:MULTISPECIES: HpcH/HpaI aldolase/citrate lyase family protein [Yersiniaceae]MBS0968557.1 HpcH/HpaI aldolase/citrate lyase family protein [Nissabacter archeti]MDV5139821.1 HpcH/HpaI aldolase/citrate lyase family protein [Chimaeribacter arupi]PLR33484.1 citrate lyase subunit beta [Chimaeribacter arupi]PLR49355.1 citrate lyase subunit beta [Chimaeribacter arupi]PLR53715.1 citrate lyase subunit beta [Chimaeribacter arupi]
MKLITPNDLGATMYVPATHPELTAIAQGKKYPELLSMVICLEDAVLDRDIPQALDNLRRTLAVLANGQTGGDGPLLFIRPRHALMASALIRDESLSLAAVDGLVLPKFTLDSLDTWLSLTAGTHLRWMPTLEDAQVYDVSRMQALADALQARAADRVLALRIGGNDLMSVLGLRRSREHTLYEGPLGYVIKMLVSVFGSRGFSLTSPVCELIDSPEMLRRELKQDMLHGMVGKTAIHPSQIAIIHGALKVAPRDYQEALRILNADSAVFKSDGAMCEPATHVNWAHRIIQLGQKYGYADPSAPDAERINHVG